MAKKKQRKCEIFNAFSLVQGPEKSEKIHDNVQIVAFEDIIYLLYNNLQIFEIHDFFFKLKFN